jgi:hypothetical protein
MMVHFARMIITEHHYLNLIHRELLQDIVRKFGSWQVVPVQSVISFAHRHIAKQ